MDPGTRQRFKKIKKRFCYNCRAPPVAPRHRVPPPATGPSRRRPPHVPVAAASGPLPSAPSGRGPPTGPSRRLVALRPPRSPWASLRQGSTDGARDGEKKIREREMRGSVCGGR
ncbi:hypothetical protein PVAP13_2NG331606 [Panicum virgatum]|uniref:Uncharacterized protein n=1 Tax=Panicum virgatum TaxID=38727 RepID=A0A8T0VMG2_PANVG|nr:hypothetical protein PVAP13_2NG331606 [Panicum virgatum]